jgi:integrase
MASIRARSGQLFFDFRYAGLRCRELTALPDSPANRRRMEAVLKKIEEDIALNRFDYRRYFPNSPMAARLAAVSTSAAEAVEPQLATDATPLFKTFAEDWYRDKSVEWRHSYQGAVRFILDKHLLPAMGELRMAQIDRPRVLALRTHLATSGERQRSPATTNKIMGILSMIMAEATLRLSITNPCASVKRLKLKRTDIQPFTMDEVSLLVRSVRADYSDYLLVRCLTGMRSGEVHGLRWDCVDFERREIRIRETYAHGRVEYTKTDGSQREIWMSQPVFDALRRMQSRTGALGQYVFCAQGGTPIDNHNFIKRVWNPLLRHLGLKVRRPYEMRHTCATLWLAAGENPEWIARQLGHTTTEMLFRVYSRYVPNLTRRDGSAFDSLVSSVIRSTPPANDLRPASAQTEESRHG